MAEIEIQTGLRENVVGFLERFAEAAAVDPISAAMLAVGGILVLFSAGLFGLFTLGAAAASVRRLLPTSGGPPQRAR